MSEDTQLPEEKEEATAEPADKPAEETTEEKAAPETPKEEPAAPPPRIAHPLWRGFWLAVVLLACFVLMGWEPALGLAWASQPLRAFAGAVLAGGCAASLPGVLKGNKPAAPSWKRCVLALLCGALWGVIG